MGIFDVPSRTVDLPSKTPFALLRHRVFKYLFKNLNFFRIHVLAFVIIPLIASGLFVACNGEFKISYIDAVFLCYSSMAVCGLSTINLSTTTIGQQVILYVLMQIGDFTFVSWLMVLTRRQFFISRCKEVIRVDKERRKFARPPTMEPKDGEAQPRRKSFSLVSRPMDLRPHRSIINEEPVPESPITGSQAEAETTSPTTTTAFTTGFVRSPTISGPTNPHSQPAIHIQEQPRPHREGSRPPHLALRRTGTSMSRRMYNDDVPETIYDKARPKKHSGFGGWMTPYEVFVAALKRMFGKETKALAKTLTRNSTAYTQPDKNTYSWLNFDGLRIGRNSRFNMEELSSEQLSEIGGLEYRALNALAWIVPFYLVTMQFMSFSALAIYFHQNKSYDYVLQQQPKLVNKYWYLLFQVTSGYTGGGLSLVDLSMVPYVNNAFYVVVLLIPTCAGNLLMPVMLRFFVWSIFKLTPNTTELHGTLEFLLAHSRRVYLYLFPSYQTWFILCLALFLSTLQWVSFVVLNIGLPVYNELSPIERALAGLFQSIATRASGFAITSTSALAPAVQLLYCYMMYIAIYPIVMFMRSTNVYEERGLGLYEAKDTDDSAGPELTGSKTEIFSKYLSFHVRRQLTNDVWWILGSMVLIDIIERGHLMNENEFGWFTQFRCIFEIISAFGGIGLSLGVPYDNFAFSGSFKVLSKLVVIAVMVRGRHRELPIAVDRAVLLPGRFKKINDELDEHDAEEAEDSDGEPNPAHMRRGRSPTPREDSSVKEKLSGSETVVPVDSV